MRKLEEIKKMGFKVTWKLIEIGYSGDKIIQQQIDKEDIIEYCYSLLENEEFNPDEVAQLIGEKSDNYEFNKILDKLVKYDNSNIELQTRKWIVYLTEKMIEDLRGDYFERLLEISEFWISLGQPSNSPHIFQSVGNKLTPKEYYTEEMFKLILTKHKEWINREIKEIIELEA